MRKSSRRLTKSERRILQFIAEHGPVHGYILKKSKKIDYSDKTIYLSLDSLKEKGLLIKVSPTDQKSPGLPKKIYHITLEGLLVALGVDNTLWKKIDGIAKKWKSLLPFIFDRWNIFHKVGLSLEVRRALKKSVDNLFLEWKFEHKNDEESIRQSFEENFIDYFIKVPIPKQVLVKWHQIVKSDKKLLEKQQNRLELQMIMSFSLFEHQRKLLEITKMLDQSNVDWKKSKN